VRWLGKYKYWPVGILIAFILTGIAVYKIAGSFSLTVSDKPVSLEEAKQQGGVREVNRDDIVEEEGKAIGIEESITDFHAYFNKLLCWGAWRTLDPQSKQAQLTEKINEIEEDLLSETKGTLKADLQTAVNGINKAIETNDAKEMLVTHRIFHDLDAVMNGVEVNTYWGATETYGTRSEN
jgi:hypothetical protein